MKKFTEWLSLYIVTPDSGDDAAFRKDVKTILLTEH
jgi:hypothetical protein